MRKKKTASAAIDLTRLIHKTLATSVKIAMGAALVAWTTAANAASPGDIVINEFLASNNSGYTDEAGDFEDWVELHNTTSSAIDVGGMYFTDDLADPTLWEIPTSDPTATTIPAGGYLVFWFDRDTADGILHVDAKLGASGEDIGLFDVDGVTAIDTYTFGQQTSDVTEGRESDGASNFVFFLSPSPGAANVYTSAGATDDPVFDQDGCYVSSPFAVDVTSGTAGAVVHYTTDGSVPDMSSPIASGPLNLTGPTAIRARAYAPGFDPSSVITQTFLVDVTHDFALLSVTTDQDLLTGPAGIFTLFTENFDVVANIELYEPDCSLAFNQLAEIEVQGGTSQTYPQKSLSIKAKSSLGNTYFDYPIWPHTGIDKYKSFVARNSGQDYQQTKFRDAFLQSIVDESADVEDRILPLRQDGQAARPAITYINGEYYGIHNLRERIDWRYIETYYGVEEDEFTFVNRRWATTGSSQRNDELFDYIQNNDLSIESNFDYMRYIIDIENYIDYMIFEMYVDNGDWPRNNLKYWREEADGGQWRWFVFDIDWSTRDAATRTFARLLDTSLANTDHNELWSTELFRKMMSNAGFRAEFMNRLADQMNVVWDSARVQARLDQYIATYANERQIHADFWDGGTNPSTIWTDRMSDFFQNRAPNMYADAIAEVPGVTGTATVTLDASPAGAGLVQFNTTFPTAANLPFSGTWFTGLPVPIKARPEIGQVFTGWSDTSIPQTEDSVVTLSGNMALTANFGPGSASTDPIIINEINYNSADCPDPGDWIELHNPTTNSVDISGWYVGDEGGGTYSIPANTVLAPGDYLVVAQELAEFSAEYPGVTNVVGSFGEGPNGFGLKGGGEEVTLYNAPGAIIDVVDYDDGAPWPTSPDGDGDTAQLTSAAADNNDGANWTGDAPSPGVANGTAVVSVCEGGGGSSSSSTGGSTGSTGGSTSSTGGSTSSTGGSTSSTGGSTSSTGGSTSSTGGSTSSTGGSTSSTGGSSSSGGSGTNSEPSLAYPGSQTTQCNVPVALQLSATDVDGDSLVWTASGLPAGLSIDQTGLISGTIPQPAGSNVSVSVNDGTTDSNEIRFYWGAWSCATGGSSGGSSTSSTGGGTSSTGGSTSSTGGSTSSTGGSSSSGGSGTNTAPSLAYPGSQSTQCNTSVALQLSASDLDGDSLAWTASGLLPGLSIDQNGLISGTIPQPAGSTISVTVNDGTTDSNEIRFYWGAWNCAVGGSSGGSTGSTGGSTGSTGGSTSSGGSTGGGAGTNQQPYILYPGTQETLCNMPVSLQLGYVDQDGDSVSWTASNLHPGLSIDQNGLISGTISQPGGKRITVIINDGTVDSNPKHFWWGAYSCAP